MRQVDRPSVCLGDQVSTDGEHTNKYVPVPWETAHTEGLSEAHIYEMIDYLNRPCLLNLKKMQGQC